MMRPYYKQSLSSKRIILALSSFFIFSYTISLADAQKTSNSTELDTLFERANTLFNQKNYDEAIQYYDKISSINASDIDALNH